jgi:hypothetical protein
MKDGLISLANGFIHILQNLEILNIHGRDKVDGTMGGLNYYNKFANIFKNKL